MPCPSLIGLFGRGVAGSGRLNMRREWPMNRRSHGWTVFALVCGALSLGACSHRATSAQALEERVKEYWVARESRDLLTQYKLEAAAQPGGWLTPDKMALLGGLRIRGVKAKEVKVKDDKATVTVSANVQIGQMGWVPQETQDHWVLLEGKWYHQTPGWEAPGRRHRGKPQPTTEGAEKPGQGPQGVQPPEAQTARGQERAPGTGDQSIKRRDESSPVSVGSQAGVPVGSEPNGHGD
jgi:hypothetical protein